MSQDNQQIPTRDRVIIGMLIFFLAIGFSLELYWVINRYDLVRLADDNWMAYLFEIYGAADRSYFDAISPLSSSLEIINVFITQWVNILLIWAIVQKKPMRYPLQLLVGSYLTYSVVLYFWAAHISGYADMVEKTPFNFFLFYAPNLPWMFGYLYMSFDAFRVIRRLFVADGSEVSVSPIEDHPSAGRLSAQSR